MTKEDTSLPVEMGRLEIEPVKVVKTTDEKVQSRGSFFTRAFIPNYACSCVVQKKSKNFISKKKHTKLLKEPVLKLLQSSSKDDLRVCKPSCNKILHSISTIQNTDNISLCTLVDNCNQLKISPTSSEQTTVSAQNNVCKWWKNGSINTRLKTESVGDKNLTGSCSQQALNPPCDVTIDELASYFETLVHIPRKMSSMAEMMYI